MPTQAKIETVGELRGRVERCQGIYLVEYKGLNVKSISELRRRIREAGAEMIVVKNRLLNLALSGTPAESLNAYLKGPNAVIFCDADALAPAKVMQEFQRTNEALVWKGGYVDGTVLDAAGMKRIADLPSKPEIVAGVVGAVAGPLSGLVFTLNGLVSELVFTLQAVADKRQEAA
ncbi:MAG: 50S ribosomal protein L10 [Armatimonadetes bacterium]|nr:50S ribosomal protein L10 [Armatimonadota bacterium]